MKNEEWLFGDEIELEYHTKQYEHPKLYTLKLLEYIDEWKIIKNQSNILDIGCGCGSVINLLSKKFNHVFFDGFDINKIYIDIANENRTNNCNFYCNDMTNKNYKKYDGILSLQTLSWLSFKDYKKTIKNILKSDPEWILITSLFYDGLVDTKIQIRDFSRKMNNKNYRKSYYNIYSINKFKSFFQEYYIDKCLPFEINIDLEKPLSKGMGTYTEKLENGKRIQMSGPLMMPWYTILLKKIK